MEIATREIAEIRGVSRRKVNGAVPNWLEINLETKEKYLESSLGGTIVKTNFTKFSISANLLLKKMGNNFAIFECLIDSISPSFSFCY